MPSDEPAEKIYVVIGFVPFLGVFMFLVSSDSTAKVIVAGVVAYAAVLVVPLGSGS
jgi:hypothetical protein